jgi:hypothetical protein
MEKKIIIDETIDKINNLQNEKDKDTFIKIFNEIKNSINKIDKILEEKCEIDENTPIDVLFNILEEYNDFVNSNSKHIDIDNFKKIKDITELIEKKLNNKMTIYEIK